MVNINNKKRRNKAKIWLIKQNVKKLRKRTKRKEKCKQKLRNSNDFSKVTHYSHYDRKNQEFKFLAPKQFSIMTNPKETIEYFNEVIHKINGKIHHKLTINFLLI